MKARWLKRDNNGVDEKFYPITHVDAIVMGEGDEPMGDHFKDTNNPHNVTAEQVGALPRTGGTLSGSVKVNNGYGQVRANNNALFLESHKSGDDNSPRMLYLANTNFKSNIHESLVLRSPNENGVSNDYIIFGTHNQEFLNAEIEKSFANGGMSTLQSAIQITNALISDTDSAFTGTGKGRLFISSPTNLSAYVTIDGKSIGTANARSTFEVDFLQSFSVKASGTSGLHCTAVFY